jgi:hypothetical protein
MGFGIQFIFSTSSMLSIHYCRIQLHSSHLWRKLICTDHHLTSSRNLRPNINRSVTSYYDLSELAWDLIGSAKLAWLIWRRKVWVLCSPPSCSLFSEKLKGFTCIHFRASVVNTDVVSRSAGIPRTITRSSGRSLPICLSKEGYWKLRLPKCTERNASWTRFITNIAW